MGFYSQIGQDKWVCEYFNFKRDGYFVDIGAYDGVWWDNTYYLEKELGWKGICIEPGLASFRKLQKSRTCHCVRAYISNYTGMIDFSAPEYHLRTHGAKMKAVVHTMQEILSIYAAPKVIDYISLDVDGPECEVLRGFPFDKHEVILWTIEHDMYSKGPKIKIEIKKIMETNGYVIAKENMSDGDKPFEDWYINKKYL